jgi:hypothetical protein
MRCVRVVLLGAVLLALAAAGCLEFDKQTIYFEHDQAKDRLIMVIEYGGLYAQKENGQVDVAQARQQLDEAVKDREAAFFGNWPWLWSSSRIRQQMADPKQQDPDMTQSERDKLKRLTDLVTVLNAGFYTDAAGRACGAQVVVVEPVTEALDLINGAINEQVLSEAGQEPADKQSEFGRLAAEAARNGHRWVELDGNSLTVRLPMTEDLLRRDWAESVADVLRDEGGAPTPLVAVLRQFLSTPMFIWYQDGVLSFKLGLPSRPFTLNSRPRQGEYQPNMADYIKEKYGFDLDARLARYLEKPDAPAEEEADRAAKLMAPRLTLEHRVSVLVQQLQSAPSDALWDLLRKTPAPPGVTFRPETASDEDLLESWQAWLSKQAGSEAPGTPVQGDADGHAQVQ